jgi:hypothetical protein
LGMFTSLIKLTAAGGAVSIPIRIFSGPVPPLAKPPVRPARPIVNSARCRSTALRNWTRLVAFEASLTLDTDSG